jgi:hypothetical protein
LEELSFYASAFVAAPYWQQSTITQRWFEGQQAPAATREPRVCPECQHVFQGNGWDGIDANWKAKHGSVMPYSEAWPLIQAGTYTEAPR